MEAIKPVSTMRTPSGGSNPASPSRRKPPLVLRLLSLLCFAAGFVIVATPLVLRAMSQAEQTAAVTAAANRVDGWPYPKAEEALAAARAELRAAQGVDLDYLVITDPDLGELPSDVPPGTEARALIAARVGTTRLIDNLEMV